MSLAVSRLEFESVGWGPAEIDPVDIELLAESTELSRDDCLQRLSSYAPDEMARAWREADPKTPEDIRRFYAQTDLYLWELFGWNGSAAYEPYLRRVETLAQLWPPSEHPRALDYGSGIGTAALRLAELGYSVTIADIPGPTLDFARARLARRGYRAEVIEIVDDVPQLPQESWNVLTCFDVLEHVPEPARLAKMLVKSLGPGGGGAIVASFDWGDECWPHHLASGRRRFSGHRWEFFLRSLGMLPSEDGVYRKTSSSAAAFRRVRYAFWRATGIYVERVAR